MSTFARRLKRPSLDFVLNRAHLSVALIAVLMAGLTITIAGLCAMRIYAEQNLNLIARSMSYTAEAAVVFGDALAAQEAITAIGPHEDIAEVRILDRREHLLARWEQHEDGARYRVEQTLTQWLLPDRLIFPITHEGVPIGQVQLIPHSRGLLQFLRNGLICVLGCLLVSMIIAFYLSRRMQAGITGPLRDLARVAHRVRRDRSFELRVPPARIAELNALNDDFNALLDELEDWQRHLQKEHAFLSHRANHDSLTGLSNRAMLESELDRAIRDAGRTDTRVAVLFLDSDRFKEINDQFGHAAGDKVLKSIATRIKGQLRKGDLVARLGGDEFAILLKPLHQSSDAMHIADQIINSMNAPITLPNGNNIVTSLSIGVAVYPDHAADRTSMLGAADEAMYRAKHMRRGSRQLAGQKK